MKENQNARILILALFFLSGFAALVYEVIWLRSLATIFGSTTFATTTILSSFMGGLALGSFIFGKVADRSRRPLVLYGILEIGIAVFALLFPLIIRSYDDLYIFLYQKTSLSFYVLSLARFAACFMVLIIPTTLMGGTFPVISRYYIKRHSQLTSNVGILYSLNTFGAVTGVFLAGFFFIERFGISTTSMIAVVVNLAVGVVAIALKPHGSVELETGSPVVETKGNDGLSKSGKDKRAGKSKKKLSPKKGTGIEYSRRLIIIAAFLSGFAALAYEVIWTRTLIFILDSFVYSFSIMLTTFLIGISLGSLIISRTAHKIKDGYFLFFLLFILIGIMTSSSLLFFAKLTMWKESYQAALSQNVTMGSPAPWGRYILFKFMISFFIMALPAIMMGAIFPLAIKLYSSNLKDLGRKIGSVYASNTLGSIIGSFIAGFVLIPFIGLRNALLVIAGVSILTGVILLLFRSRPFISRRVLIGAGIVGIFGIFVCNLPKDIYMRIFQQAQKDYELIYYKEDPTATVTAHKRGDKVLINLNGLNVAGTDFNFLTTQKIQAHLAMLLHPGPERVLQVGFGSGGTAYSASLHESIRDIDCVEICEGVIQAANHFIPSNYRVLENPVINLYIEDARNYILATPHHYDLILSDSIHPTYAGNGTLYSQDYFELCKKKLNDGGYVSFWMPMYLLSERDFKTIIKTFQSVFPYVTIWYVNNAIEAYTIVIGRREPFELNLELLRKKLRNPAIAKDLASIDVMNEHDILSYFMLGPETVKLFCSDGDINSDNHPVIEFRAPKSMTRRRTWHRNLSNLLDMRESPGPLIRNAAATKEEEEVFFSRLARKHRAVNILIKGQLVNIISFDFAREHRYYMEAAKIDPESRSIQRLSALAASRVMNQKGKEALGRNDFQQALDFFGQSISINPDPYDVTVGDSRFRTGYIYWKLGDGDRAGEELDLCLSVFPTHKQALIIGAVIAFNSSRRHEAREKLERLLKLYPGDGEVMTLKKRLSDHI